MLDPVSFPDVQVVFLDLDDTLCGYWDAAKLGLREAFDEVKPSGFTTEQMTSAWAESFREFAPTLKKTGWYQIYLKEGEPTRTEQMRLTLERLNITDVPLAQAMSKAYMEARDRNLKLFPESLGVLKDLSATYRLGLLTNGPADIQRQEVATTGIEPFFTWICIEGEMDRGKPLPEVFEHCRQLAGVQPEQMLMIGNSYAHDILPAIKAGWKTAWIRRPSDVAPSASGPEDKPIDAPEPTLTINNLRQVLAVSS